MMLPGVVIAPVRAGERVWCAPLVREGGREGGRDGHRREKGRQPERRVLLGETGIEGRVQNGQ